MAGAHFICAAVVKMDSNIFIIAFGHCLGSITRQISGEAVRCS